MAKTAAVKEALRPNAFTGKDKAPTQKELTKALGDTAVLWRSLLAELARLGAESGDWHCYSKKAGWSWRAKQGERTIVYLSPLSGRFRASFAFGDKAVKDALASDLAAEVKATIRSAKKYAEGTAVRMEVNSPEDGAAVSALAAIKIRN